MGMYTISSRSNASISTSVIVQVSESSWCFSIGQNSKFKVLKALKKQKKKIKEKPSFLRKTSSRTKKLTIDTCNFY